MVAKPDAGDIVSQTAAPILPDDTAGEVFNKVTLAAELTLYRVLPLLIADNAPRIVQDLSQGSYFSGRKPEDGCIDWSWSAERIHNLVRAVAPPYPGAFTTLNGQPVRMLRSRSIGTAADNRPAPLLALDNNRLVAHCVGGGLLQILALELAGALVIPSQLANLIGPGPWRLGD